MKEKDEPDDPHEVIEMECDVCTYKWIAVCPTGTIVLECPECGFFSLINHKEEQP
jgi:hypothetical protein